MEEIYEVLNHAIMNLDEFEDEKLSDYESKIAKKQVLREIRKMKSSKTRWKRKLATAAACACVIIGMGTISVAAGWLPLPDSLKTILGIHTEKEMEIANKMGAATNVVAEDNGYKIMAEGIIGDDKNKAIVFKIEKSDGSTLLEHGEVPEAVEFQGINNENDTGSHGRTGYVDGSSNAHSMEYYIALTYMDSVKDTILISLEDMQLWVQDEKLDISGKWEFAIPYNIQDCSVNLAAGQRFQYGNGEGTIDEFMISPIGFSVRVTTTDKMTGSDFIDMPLKMYLKSGEVIELNGGSGTVDNGDGTWSWREDGVYENMILLDNIESVMIGDTKLTVK